MKPKDTKNQLTENKLEQYFLNDFANSINFDKLYKEAKRDLKRAKRTAQILKKYPLPKF